MCSTELFTSGVGDKRLAVRIPSAVRIHKKGYIEDRRPASNIDPYVVAAKLCSTILLEGKEFESIQQHYNDWIQEFHDQDG